MQLLCYQSNRSKLFKVLTHSIGSCTLTGSLFQEHNCFNLLGDELPLIECAQEDRIFEQRRRGLFIGLGRGFFIEPGTGARQVGAEIAALDCGIQVGSARLPGVDVRDGGTEHRGREE